MRIVRCLLYFAAAALLSTVATAQDDPNRFSYLHDACHRLGGGGGTLSITVNATNTKVFRLTYDGNSESYVSSPPVYYGQPLVSPVIDGPATPWPEGPAFAAWLQSQNEFPTTAPIVSATWQRTGYSRVDVLEFTTNTGEIIKFQSQDCGSSNWLNCGYQRHCYPGLEGCCGYNTGTPRCIAAGSGNFCCEISDESAVCSAGQTCCAQGYGSGGPRAQCCNSSSTCCGSTNGDQKQCCGAGTTCCTSSWQSKCCDAGATCCKSADYTANCCPSGTTCCANDSGLAMCCAATEFCDLANHRCSPQTTTSTAPSPVPTTPQDPNAPRRACLASGTTYYDITTGPSGTTLQRWSNGQLVDSNWYARLNTPAAGTTTWDEGVAYAATMQTRNVWVYTGPTQAATWEVVAGEDIWRFSTTINGAATQVVFRTSSCVAMTPRPPTAAPPTTAAPATPNPNAPRRACLTSASIYYDITTGPSGTTLQRWSNGQLLDSNWYARLNTPAAGTTTWDEGVAYAATMQTRNVWAYTGPTQAATWEVVAGEDIWRFSTTINGAATQVVFRTSNCV